MPITSGPADSHALFPGFARRTLPGTDGVMLRAVVGPSNGPPLLLLHGYPQTLAIWHRVAPALAREFTVIATDLRGYGESSKPPGGKRHEAYSKRAMAADQVAAMRSLGHEEFFLAGHDRGGRVAHRLALDHPERVRRLAVLDIAPTLDMYRDTSEVFARAYWHWFFLIQPAPMPERLIGAEPAFFLRSKLGSPGGGRSSLAMSDPAALAEYERCFSNPETIRATCEDYRAAADLDLEHDEADLDHRIACPLLALWGKRGTIERCFDARELWTERCAGPLKAEALPGGHYLAEELPELVLARFRAFFAA